MFHDANKENANTVLEMPEVFDNLNLYIKITFDGQTVNILCIFNKLKQVIFVNKLQKKTSIQQATNQPEWNDTIEFKYFYPPLVRMFKIQLCTEEAPRVERVLASEYLTIYDISSYTKDFFYLPAYGPRFINLYDQPENCRLKKTLNEQCGDDLLVHNNLNSSYYKIRSERNTYSSIRPNNFIARVYLSVETEDLSESNDLNNNNRNSAESNDSISFNYQNFNEEFVAYAVINEVSMIDPRFKNGQLKFQMTLGNFKN